MKKILALLLSFALVLGLAACGGKPAGPDASDPGESARGVRTLAAAAYPEMAPYPNEEDYYDKRGEWDDESYSEDWDKWRDSRAAIRPEDPSYAADVKGYGKAVVSRLLSGTDGENRVCSPVNVYMALGMLAEITDGSSRQQILDLMGAADLETARRTAETIWRSVYNDDGLYTCTLASSMWLRDHDVDFNQQTLDTLARLYYADAYAGDPASQEMNEAMQDWINDHTGDLLREQASQEKLDAHTVLALITAIYYKAGWQSEFYEQFNTQETFHTPAGDQTCTFMHGREDVYDYGDRFGAVSRSLGEGGRMLLLLPEEGVAPEDLLTDEEALTYLTDSVSWDKSKRLQVNLSLPKFDVASRMDLIPMLADLGVTDVLDDETADFSPLTADDADLALTQAAHAARVKIDEKGVEAAAYTILTVGETAAAEKPEEMDFVLDRPFLFAIVSPDGLPLFTGVVNDPTA